MRGRPQKEDADTKLSVSFWSLPLGGELGEH